MTGIHRILCPIDIYDVPTEAVKLTDTLCSMSGSEFCALYVIESDNIIALPQGQFFIERGVSPDDAEKHLRKIVSQAVTVCPDVRVAVEEGDVASTIVRTAASTHADLIVLSRTERSRIEAVLSPSIPDKVIRTAGCPTLVAPRPDGPSASPELHPSSMVLWNY